MAEELSLVILRTVLGILAVYHLGIGLTATFSLESTARLTRVLYGLDLGNGPQLEYAVKMLGLFALVFGGLLAFAVIYPRGHPEIIVAAIVLQSLRALSRMRFHGLMQTAFGVSPTRNRAHAALLVAEVIVLAAALPVALR